MPGQYVEENWQLTNSITLVLCFTTAVLYALYTLSFPPPTRVSRKLSVLILAIPTWYAFRYSDQLTPNYIVVDTFARTCLIWFAHMSYEVCVVEFAPVLPQEKRDVGEWEQTKERVRQGYKVLFDRNHTQVLQQRDLNLPPTSDGMLAKKEMVGEEQYTATDKKTDEPVLPGSRVQHGVALSIGHGHGYSRWGFVAYHILKGLFYYRLQCAYYIYETSFSPLVVPPSEFMRPELASIFQRFAASVDYKELFWRIEFTFDWCVVSLWLYESFHSMFAVLYVGSGLDGPEEWSTALFGPFSAAWSVRRYWGKHWHNYVYHSFSGHIKCITRGWLGLKRGAVSTRLIENTLVFLASGLMHSLVRWQQAPYGDFWAISCWYVAQMLPIIFETVVAHQWSRVRKWLGFRADARLLNRVEYVIGYLWIIFWFSYSVPRYYQTRIAWSDTKKLKKFAAELAAARALNETRADW